MGRYVLLAPIAQGGMAEIWLARQSGMKGFEKLVVVKRMINALEADPEYVEMFLAEARLAAQLNHPNVVQIYELGEQADSLYIAMEYLDGENLSVLRRTSNQRGLPLLDHLSARVVSRVAEGLGYAHTRVGLDGKALSIVHRDVSPQNIIVTYDGGTKIVDFGIAKASSHQTQSGKLKGKLAYMSPEQARGEPVDARSDVFALGIVLFELLTRTRLFPKMQDLEILTALGNEKPLPRPSDRRPDVPPDLDAIVTRAMAPKRERRYQSAREFQDALETWLRSTSLPASNADVADYMRALFAQRIEERRQLIEAAMRSELTPHGAEGIKKLARQDGTGAVGSGNSKSLSAPAPGNRPRWLVPAAAVAAFALVGIGVAATLLGRSATPTVVSIETLPRGAKLTVDGVPSGRSPLSLEGLTPGLHSIVAALDGHQSSTREVNIEQPGQRIDLQLALTPNPQPVAEVVPPPPPPEPVVPAVEPEPEPVVPSKPRAARKAAEGKLTLKTTPWTTVYFGKRKLGDTPLMNVSLPAGKHLLRLTNPDRGTESIIEVEIAANKTTVKKLKL